MFYHENVSLLPIICFVIDSEYKAMSLCDVCGDQMMTSSSLCSVKQLVDLY